MGGKSKKQTIGYKYYIGMHQVTCHGPIDYISRVTVDDRIAWSGQSIGGGITVDAESLFGGESREGGVSGTIDVEMGKPDQIQNSYLVSKLGSTVPAYRGVVSMVFRQCYVGNNPYLKPWRFRGSRIHVRQNNLPQWYDEKSEIVGIAPGASITTETIDMDAVSNGASTPTGGLTAGVEITGFNPTDILVITPNNSGPNVAWSPWGVPSPVVAHTSGSVYRFSVIKDGDVLNVQTFDAGSVYAGYSAARSAFNALYPNGVYLYGASAYKFYIEDTIFSDNSGGISLTIDVYPGATIDMNASHIIRECLTDPDWGMGYLESDIEDSTFIASADQLHLEGLGMSLLWDKSISIDSFINEVVRHIDATLYVSRTTGKFCLKLIRADYDEGSLLSLDESNIARVEDPARASFGELTNSVTVNYWDALTGKDASLTVTDTALVQVQGAVINVPLQYPGFTNGRNASIVGQRDLRSLSSPLLSCTIYANSVAKDLNVGDVFKFSWAKWEITDLVMRITSVAIGNGRSNQIKIACVQDSFDTPTSVVMTGGQTEWQDPSQAPSPMVFQIAMEAPYYELIQLFGQSNVDADLDITTDGGYVLAAGPSPASAINSRMWTDNGTGYSDADTMEFCPYAELAVDITKLETTISFENGIDIDLISIGSYFQIGDELFRVDTVDEIGSTITVGRGILDTVPVDHIAGEGIYFWDRASAVDPSEYVLSEEIGIKILPVSGSGQVTLSDAVEMLVTLDQRAYRPYPPGNLTIEGESYGTGPYTGELTIAWAHRDRKQQTSGTHADHFDGDIGPEVGTVYRVRGYINDVLVHTENDIAGTSAVWTPATSSSNILVEVHSKRDGVYSWQAPFHNFSNIVSGPIYSEEGDELYSEDGSAIYSE